MIYKCKKKLYKKDFTNLIKKINNNEDKKLFEEAIRCYRTSAFRASYILIWLCGLESIKRRLKLIASSDNEIGKIVGEIDKKEKNHKSIDKYLLDKYKDLGLLLM